MGTSGWQYDHWREAFYPEGLPKAKWFDFYARHFDTVEVNFSFYRQPSAATWDRWREGARPGFRFAVKANRFLTHILRFRDSGDALKRFVGGAERLGEHLGPLLYQAPPDYRKTPENLTRLDEFMSALPEGRVHAFEFRNDSWFDDETLALLRKHRVAFCSHDMHGLHCPLAVTSDVAYIRFHGGPEPYAGNYDEAALQKWADLLLTLWPEVREVWAFFNNDIGARAPDNARRLIEILEKRLGREL